MNDLSNFSQYHPSWEDGDLTKQEYTSLLDALSKKKSDEQLLTDGKTVRVLQKSILNDTLLIWQKVKGFFGFTNQADPVKVNYALLKLLRYGENHHYFKDQQIRTLVRQLKTSIEQDKKQSYANIATIIDTILLHRNDVEPATLINREIKEYFHAHQDHLHDSFWPHLIHKYMAPIRHDAARLHYNQATMYLAEDDIPKAIESLKQALKMIPNRPIWQLTLAKTLLTRSKNEPTEDALKTCKAASTILKGVSIEKNHEISQEWNEVSTTLSLSYCALHIKTENYQAAIHDLQESKNKTIGRNPITTYEEFIAEHPSFRASNFQQATFTLEAAKTRTFTQDPIRLFEKAIHKYHEAYSDSNDLLVNQKLIETHLHLAKYSLTADKIMLAKQSLDSAWKILQSLGATPSPQIFYDEFKTVAKSLLQRIDQENNRDSAIDVARYLKNLCGANRQLRANYCTILADLYRDDKQVLAELEEAYKLAPSGELNARIIELAKRLGKKALEENRQKDAIDYFTKVQALALKDIEMLRHLSDLNFNLSNWQEAEQWTKKLIEENRNDPAPLLLASSISKKLDKKIEAIDYANNALKIDPKNSKAIIMLYELTGQIDKTNIDGAITAATDILDKSRDKWEVHLQLGSLHQAKKNHTQALQCFEEAKRLNPDNIEILTTLGDFFLERREYGKALAEFTRAAELRQSTTPFQEQLMSCYAPLAEEAFSLGHFDQMVDYYKKIFSMGSVQASEMIQKLAAIGKGLEHKNLEHAIELYKIIDPHLNKNIILPSELVKIYQTLGVSEEKSSFYESAALFFKKAQAIEPNNVHSLNLLAGCYAKSAAVAPLSHGQKQAIADNFLVLGRDFLQIGQNDSAYDCFSQVFAIAQEVAKLPQGLVAEAYDHLAKTQIKNMQFSEAADTYQKALHAFPSHIAFIRASADLAASQGNRERAAELYQQAATLAPQDPIHLAKAIATELAIADQYYAKGIHDPERVRQSILDLTEKAISQKFPHAKKIEDALGRLRGRNSSENQSLRKLARNAETPDQIELDGSRACELLETAYDGGWFHMKPAEMPQELTLAIRTVREQLEAMRSYYQTVQRLTDELMNSIPPSSSREAWVALPKIQDLKNASAVEEQARKALQLIDNASTALPPLIQQKINTLRQFLLPSGWMHVAIIHYDTVLKLNPNVYGEHCNKLIDAYAKVGNPVKAHVTYEELKTKFPHASLTIDLNIYSKIASDPALKMHVSTPNLFDGLISAATQQEQKKNYSQAVGSYKQAIEKATQEQVASVAHSLLTLGDSLFEGPEQSVAIDAYKTIVPNFESLGLDQKKRTQILKRIAEDAKKSQDYAKAMNYVSQALMLTLNDASLNAEKGELHLLQNDDTANALTYYQKALEIEPTNPTYRRRVADIEIAIGDKCYALGVSQKLAESLRDLVKFATTDAPYADQIKTALNTGWTSFFSEYSELCKLEALTSSPDEIETSSLRALELIKIAYDGKAKHMKLDEMPEDLVWRLEIFTHHLVHFQEARKMIPQRSENIAKQNLLINPLQEALASYERGYAHFPTVYGNYLNHHVNALILQNEPLKAVTLYKRLKESFPSSPLKINPSAYKAAFEAFLNLKDRKYELALKIINEAIADYPNIAALKKCKSDLYFSLGEIARRNNNIQDVLKLYTLATKCGVDAKAECYIELSKLYLSAMYQSDENQFNIINSTQIEHPSSDPTYSFLSLDNLKGQEYPTTYQAAIRNLKKAADIRQNDAELRFQLTRIHYQSLNQSVFTDDDIIPYIKKATTLEPKNVCYAFAHMTLVKSTSNDFPILLTRYKELGGEYIDNPIMWKLANPYNFPLQ